VSCNIGREILDQNEQRQENLPPLNSLHTSIAIDSDNRLYVGYYNNIDKELCIRMKSIEGSAWDYECVNDCSMGHDCVDVISLSLPFLSFTPVFLILFSRIIMGEAVSLIGGLGIALIALGGYGLNLSSLRTGPRPTRVPLTNSW
jgi:hypothetical protein